MVFRSAALRPSILVVDDDPDVRGILGMLLTNAGYGVVTAVDGAAALALAGDPRIGLIVLDLKMPRLDGDAFRRAYREQGGRAPILLVTAADIGLGAALPYGADGYIAKPFDIGRVLDMVAHLVGRK
jgi:two-component system, chemotaxis family, chemotaxis protein CheY